MFRIYADENNPNITRWALEEGTTWDDFHTGLDQLIEQANDASKPFSVIATTTGRMPQGKALSHLKRLIKIVNENDIIERFVVINNKQNPVGQAFVSMALKLFSWNDKLQIVQSEEDAQGFV